MIKPGDTVIYGIEVRPSGIVEHLAQVLETDGAMYRIRTRYGQVLLRPAHLVRKPKWITSVSWQTPY